MRPAAAVFAAALAARLAFWRLQGTLPLVGDALEYDAFARALVETGRYLGPHGEAASRMPGYPLFLAAVRLAFGGSPEAVIAVQCVLGALTCVVLMDLARRLVPERWALACGVLSAFYYDLIVPAAAPLSECLYSFLLVLSAWALYHEGWKPPRRAVAFAALSACLYLVRPEPLPYIIATILLTPYLWAKFSRKEVLSALAVFALCVSPWVGRNFVRFGRVMPASSVGKAVGYVSLYFPASKLGLAGERHYAPPELGELEAEADYAAAYEALASTLTRAQIAKAYLYNFVSILYPFLPQYDWTYMFVAPFWLLGCALAVRRRELWPVAGAVLCSLLIFTFFGGYASRYRQGVSPFIVLLAAAGMAAASDALGAPRFRLAAGSWLGANILIWAGQAQARQLALWIRAALWGR